MKWAARGAVGLVFLWAAGITLLAFWPERKLRV